MDLRGRQAKIYVLREGRCLRLALHFGIAVVEIIPGLCSKQEMLVSQALEEFEAFIRDDDR